MAYKSQQPYFAAVPFTKPFKIQTPTVTTVKGVPVKTFKDSDAVYFGTFKTFLGTESVKDGLYSVIDTGTLETWFTPELKASCRVHFMDDGTVYEVAGTPEDIRSRGQYMKVRLKGLQGGA